MHSRTVKAFLVGAFLLFCAATAEAGVIVTSVWKRVTHTVTNDVNGGRIVIQGQTIGLASFGYHGPGWTTYWHSTNDAATWRAGVSFDTTWYRTWFAFQRGSFYLGRDGNPFGISKQGYLYLQGPGDRQVPISPSLCFGHL